MFFRSPVQQKVRSLQKLPVTYIPLSSNFIQSLSHKYSIKSILPSFASYQDGSWEEERAFSHYLLVKRWYLWLMLSTSGSWLLREHCWASFHIYTWPSLWISCWGVVPLSGPGLLWGVHSTPLSTPASLLTNAVVPPETGLWQLASPWSGGCSVAFRIKSHPPVRTILPIAFSSQPCQLFHSPLAHQTLRSSGSSSSGLTWAHAWPPLLILPLHAGEGPHKTEHFSQEYEVELIKTLLLSSSSWLGGLFLFGRKVKRLFLLILPPSSHKSPAWKTQFSFFSHSLSVTFTLLILSLSFFWMFQT